MWIVAPGDRSPIDMGIAPGVVVVMTSPSKRLASGGAPAAGAPRSPAAWQTGGVSGHPTLRNVALTAPYMHDGSLRRLEAVVRFYDRGGAPHDGLDPLIDPLGLADDEVEALVAFLRASPEATSQPCGRTRGVSVSATEGLFARRGPTTTSHLRGLPRDNATPEGLTAEADG